MTIHLATLDDVPAFVEIGHALHASTRFAAHDYNAERVARQLRALIAVGQDRKRTHCFLVARDSQGRPVGGLIGRMEQPIFCEQWVASVIQYGVLPRRRMGGAGVRLLVAFRQWARNRGASELCVGVNSGVDLHRTDRLLRRLGFRLTGGNYSLMLGGGKA